jgi:hypothetical protein
VDVAADAVVVVASEVVLVASDADSADALDALALEAETLASDTDLADSDEASEADQDEWIEGTIVTEDIEVMQVLILSEVEFSYLESPQ